MCQLKYGNILYLLPKLCILQNHPGKNAPFRYGGIAFQRERDGSRNGALGDARKSSLEEGSRLNNVVLERAERMIDFIREHF